MILLGFAIAAAILVTLQYSDGPLVYLLGAWSPPLGIALRADGLSAVMMMVAALVICAVGVFASADLRQRTTEPRAQITFWVLLLAIWGALNTVFLGGDLFTLYVALELVTFAAVPWFPWMAARKRFRLHCDICSLHCSVLSSTCLARHFSMDSMAHLISCCCRIRSAQSLSRSSRRHR